MSELGGPTTQSGIIYQNSITTLYLGRLCDNSERLDKDKVTKVRSEDLTHIDDTVVTFADGHREYIQAKENLAVSGEVWTKLWKHFDAQFNDKNFVKNKDQITLQIGFPEKEHSILREICNRASTSPTSDEWFERLNKKQTDFLRKIKPNLPNYNSNDDYLLSLFKHIEISVFSLGDIERDKVPDWMPKSNKSSIELFRLLRDRVGGAARVRGSFTADELINNLKEESNVDFLTPPTLKQVQDAIKKSGAGLKQHKNTFGETNIHQKRQITDDLILWVTEKTEKNVAVILDQAGMGKTVVMRDLLEGLESQNIDVLAFKADQLLGIENKQDLQYKLDLPDDVERTLDYLSSFEKTVLIIDQIDALSLSLAHDQKTLNVLLDTIAQVRRKLNVKVIISCRTFDFHNDPRLARIEIDKRFHINELTDDEVKEVLEKADFNYDNLSPATKKLLKIPLHLDLFILSTNKLVGKDTPNSATSSIDINNLQELYTLLWQNVINKSDLHAPSKGSREKALEIITMEMNRKQQVSVPKTIITKIRDRELDDAADWLASHGILIVYKNEWNLIHQTFFDYCYAKNFVENEDSLYETVLNGDQGLFVRSQIIQVLSYLRGINFSAYLKEVNKFLTKTHIRFHLRDHVLRWFAALPNPTIEEWEIAQHLFQNSEQEVRLSMFMSGNSGWFEYLKPKFIDDLKSSDDENLNKTIGLISTFAEIKQAEVAEVLRPYLNRSDDWNKRIHNVLSYIRDWNDKEAVSLFEDYFDSISDVTKTDYFEFKSLAKFDEKVVCRLFVKLLHKILDQIISGLPEGNLSYIYSIDNQLEVLNSGYLFEILGSIIENNSEYFLDQIFPWIERVLEFSKNQEDESFPYFNSDPLSHFWEGSVYVVHHQIIQWLIKSLVNLSDSNREKFLEYVQQLSAIPYQTPQKLITRVFSESPEKFATEAHDFLTQDNRRLYIGENEVFDSRQLIKKIVPFLTGEQLRNIENEIFSLFRPNTYRSKDSFYFLFRNQMFLLQDLQPQNLSVKGKKYLAELERKFPNQKPSDKPNSIRSGYVGSPLSREIAKRMSDKSWLRAMRKYEKGVQHKEFLKGGAGELAGILSQQIKEESERFYNLALRMPKDIDSAYKSAFVNGLESSEINSDKFFDVVRHFLDFDKRENIRSFAWALEKRAKENFPDDLLEKLRDSLNSPIGEDETWWQKQEEDAKKQGYYDGANQGPYSSYLNSDRGTTFRAVMRVLDARGDDNSLNQKWEMINFAVFDESIALKAGAIEELNYLLNNDREKAIDFFNKIVNKNWRLLNVSYALNFLYYTLHTHYALVLSQH